MEKIILINALTFFQTEISRLMSLTIKTYELKKVDTHTHTHTYYTGKEGALIFRPLPYLWWGEPGRQQRQPCFLGAGFKVEAESRERQQQTLSVGHKEEHPHNKSRL